MWKICYQEKDIVQCVSCDFWIHNNVNYYIYGKYCPSCYQTKMLNVEDNINEGDINVNHRKYDAGDDDISEFNTNINSIKFRYIIITSVILSMININISFINIIFII